MTSIPKVRTHELIHGVAQILRSRLQQFGVIQIGNARTVTRSELRRAGRPRFHRLDVSLCPCGMKFAVPPTGCAQVHGRLL